MTTKLSNEAFEVVVTSTPLVAFDLLVARGDKFLLGKRFNKPAKGYWFVPGGRILKGETFDVAYSRIANEELGADISKTPVFVGVFTHMYPDGIFEGVSTHYVTIGLLATIKNDLQLPSNQHTEWKWSTKAEILEDPLVHINTKNYFLTLGWPSRVV